MGKPYRLLLHTLMWFLALLPPVSAFGLDEVTLQLLWKNQFEFAGDYVAKEKGFYRDESKRIQNHG